MAGDSTAARTPRVVRVYFCDAVITLALSWSRPMVLIVLLVLALFVFQTLLPASFRYMGGGDLGRNISTALGPRDAPPPQSRVGARAERALPNMHEALPVFLALALLNLILGTAADLATTG